MTVAQRIAASFFDINFPARTTGLVALAILAAILTIIPTAQAQTFTVVHSFTGGGDGAYPQAGLTLYGQENFYGGAGSSAVIRLSHQGTGWVLLPILELSGAGGSWTAGRLTIGPDGALYGAASYGGVTGCASGQGCGVIFRLRPPSSHCRSVDCYWNETVLYSFNPYENSLDGYAPTGGLVFDAAGNIYGTTNSGGQSGHGTVFQLSPSQGGWVETVLYSFQGMTDGRTPNGNLVINRSGILYGTTFSGGDLDCHCGTVLHSPTPLRDGLRACCTRFREVMANSFTAD